ncbi:MAG: NAD(P)H-dependent flavin oxidoreductase, partial [Promethearchaeota archaeon]
DLEENYSNINSAVDALKRNMLKFVEHSDKPFGFNIRTARMQIDAEMMCRKIPRFIMENPKLKEQCVYAITSAGSARTLPKSKTYQKLKDSGSNIKHFHVAPALWLADKCVASGVDGLVVTGGEGGGHQSYEKVSSLVLLQQVVQKHPDFPIVACGGFATGQGLAAALSMGAGAVAMGSRFIATKESEFHEAYKNVVPPAKAQDTILVTGGFGPIRLWRNEYSLHHGLVGSKEEKIAQEQAVSLEQAKKDAMAYVLVYQGNTTDGAVLLGQSIGVINNIKPVKEVIDTTIEDAEKYLKKASAYIK